MNALEDMSALARALKEADDYVKTIDDELKAAKARAREIREEVIPCAMQELGLKKFELDSGESIAIAQEVYCTIAVKDRAAAFEWLESHGFGGLIKLEVITPFAREDRQGALDLYQALSDEGRSPNMKESVAPQTLKAFLKEQIEEGADIPLDLFSARPCWTTKIKAPPKKRAAR